MNKKLASDNVIFDGYPQKGVELVRCPPVLVATPAARQPGFANTPFNPLHRF